ncbi:MAG: hypothetical protein DSO09_06475 [Candidatus Methanomethylicota archaeon]|uniref:ABC transporter ATP-binding protein n=1 Tax=Thermoproteota archaeon TaxID=2056631 RepID=A0A520KH99_9CREN|nr:MAG: ABC transporter ATP-binding protein [Candidatus Verstraetearchaeota archaeon]TDA37649.1 MAG: hypothetical protein DSO09_06475 [Candidatus Verstraetearchaeota archaeon]
MYKAVEVLGLTKWYGSILAVDHLNFEIQEGEIFGFLGPNGAGKTTTIKMLIGLVKPSEGTAKIFGFDIMKEARDAKKNIGIVWEESNIYPELSAWENLMFSGEIYHVGKKERQARATELLEKFGLYDRRNDKVGGFSKGVTYSTTEVGSFVGSSPSPLQAGLLSPARRDVALLAIFTEAL